jgi:hypothetical protein
MHLLRRLDGSKGKPSFVSGENAVILVRMLFGGFYLVKLQHWPQSEVSTIRHGSRAMVRCALTRADERRLAGSMIYDEVKV